MNEELKKLKAELQALTNRCHKKARELRTLKDALVREKIPEINYCVHGTWECKESPTGFCVYDPREEDCLFCREPEERK